MTIIDIIMGIFVAFSCMLGDMENILIPLFLLLIPMIWFSFRLIKK